MTALLAAHALNKAYGSTAALSGAEFEIAAGEIVAIMGPSGSGKSTLLHCIAGIVPPDSGTVFYDGRELSAMGDVERSALRRSEFGFVFQFGQLVPELSCRENVAMPLRLDGVSRREAERRADALLERPGGRGRRGAAARERVGRRGPARRGGACAGHRPARAVRRRADRCPGLLERRARDGAADRRRARTRDGGGAGHARGARGRVLRPRGRGPRRPHARPRPRVLVRELALGARLTLAGGRTGLLRTAITALGVALGVAVLLVAASIPSIHGERQARGDARFDLGFDQVAGHGGAGVLVADAEHALPRARHPRAAAAGRRCGRTGPAGRSPRVPRAGEVFVSPALRRLLATADGRSLLAPRIPGRIAGEIAPSGLIGPTELAYYAGASGLVEGDGVRRLSAFGTSGPHDGLNPILALLVVIVLVALLLPVAVLVGAAVRTGGEDRDRRLAALRLIGADQRMARRIAAGEALVSAALGLVARDAGVRRRARVRRSDLDLGHERVRVRRPAEPAARPRGRRSACRPRRCSCRCSPCGGSWPSRWGSSGVPRTHAAAGSGGGCCCPPSGCSRSRPLPARARTRSPSCAWRVGVIALLVGVAALLPWVVERVVGRLGAGKVAWQLAVRRLQLDPGGPARAVSGITVAVAGAIALQMVFTGIQHEFKKDTGADLSRASLIAALKDGGVSASTAASRLAAVSGVRSTAGLEQYDVGRDPDAPSSTLTVAPCATLRQVAGVTTCTDGDVFFTREAPRGQLAFGATTWTRSCRRARGPHARRPERPRARRRLRHAGRRPRRRAAQAVRVRVRAHGPGAARHRGARPQRRGRARPALARSRSSGAHGPTASSPSCAARCWSAPRS